MFDQPHFAVQYLTTLPAILSRHLLFVVPSVYLLTCSDPKASIARLKPQASEVAAIFSCQLKDLMDISEEAKLTTVDVNWLLGLPYRLHTLQHASYPSDIVGMTYDILLNVASLAYDRLPSYERFAPTQMPMHDMIEAVLEGKAGLNGDTRSVVRSTVKDQPVAEQAGRDSTS